MFTEFSACEGLDPVTKQPQKAMTEFLSTTETIYACGHLEANGSVHLRFLLVYEEDPIGWFARGEYQTGYLLEQIPPTQRKPGHYRVEVHMRRSKLASTEFTIVP
jgi:hypothetical protein